MSEKYGFISALESELDAHFNYDYELNWDKKHFAVELSFILEVENPKEVALVDADGEENQEDSILYEDTVLFYDLMKTDYNEDDYLTCIPYDAKEGLSKEFIAYFVEFLQDTADNGLDALMDFLESDESDFSIVWDSVAFEAGDEKLAETEFYPYPRY